MKTIKKVNFLEGKNSWNKTRKNLKKVKSRANHALRHDNYLTTVEKYREKIIPRVGLEPTKAMVTP